MKLSAAWNTVEPNHVAGLMATASDTQADIGQRIRQLRLALGFMQARAFCAFVGITEQALNNYEHGRRRIGIDEALKIAGKTGASLDWIYRGMDHTLPMHLLQRLEKVKADDPRPDRLASNG